MSSEIGQISITVHDVEIDWQLCFSPAFEARPAR